MTKLGIYTFKNCVISTRYYFKILLLIFHIFILYVRLTCMSKSIILYNVQSTIDLVQMTIVQTAFLTFFLEYVLIRVIIVIFLQIQIWLIYTNTTFELI